MRFTFDTQCDGANEAARLISILHLLHPTTVEHVATGPAALALALSIPDTIGDDNPAVGTATPAEVFTQGAQPTPIMTASANGTTYEQYIAAGWCDAQLIDGGLMVAPTPPPPAPSAAATVFGGTSGATAFGGTSGATAFGGTSGATAFGGASGPLVPSNGAPPAPSSTLPTTPPPSSDAAHVFGATSAPPAPPPAAASGGATSTSNAHAMLDAEGLPWDGRIHASTRTQTAKAVWKKKKGVDEAEYEAVVAELRRAQAANNAAAHVPLNAAPPPPPGANIAPPPPPPGEAVDFVAVVRYVGERNFSAEQIQDVCKRHGLAGLGLLTGAPALCAPIMAAFKAM